MYLAIQSWSHECHQNLFETVMYKWSQHHASLKDLTWKFPWKNMIKVYAESRSCRCKWNSWKAVCCDLILYMMYKIINTKFKLDQKRTYQKVLHLTVWIYYVHFYPSETFDLDSDNAIKTSFLWSGWTQSTLKSLQVIVM